jgi:ABC-type bacteriocin/lantibiotic exporter with double-glycine peptidase domain
MDAQATSQNYLVELINGIEVIKATGAEDRVMDRWTSLFVKELNNTIERSKLNANIDAVSGALRTAAGVSLTMYGALLVLRGDSTIGNMVAISAIASGFLTPLTNLVSAGTRFQTFLVYWERLSEILEATPEQAPTTTDSRIRITGKINAESVSFRYSASSPAVLSDVSFTVQPGQFIAIVGRSGSGKSTLAKLLAGMYQPTDGYISFDGLDLRSLNLRSIRSQIGSVVQQTQLFSGSILSNLTLADPSAEFTRVIAATRLAEIHEEISSMPMGYETLVGSQGTAVSGGQRQRLAIARALLSSPPVLILDEATSQLDSATEAKVFRNLETSGITRIVIAHRLSTIANAHRIFVLEQGCISETGTHEELLRSGGVYSLLMRASSHQ